MPLTMQGISSALPLWRELAGGTARLVNHSENQTFRVDTPARGSFSLRVHRTGYQSAAVHRRASWPG